MQDCLGRRARKVMDGSLFVLILVFFVGFAVGRSTKK